MRITSKSLTQLVLLVLLAGLLSACNLGSGEPAVTPTENFVPTPVGANSKPEVVITSPKDGDTATINQPILVSTTGTDDIGITRMQLRANGTIVKTVPSESLSGQKEFQAVLDYTARAAGDIELQVIAYRNSIASDPVSVTVSVGRATTGSTGGSSGGSGSSGSGSTGGGVQVQIPNDGVCRALTNVNLNFRAQPDSSLDNIILTLPASTLAPIIGRLGDNSWWKLNYGGRTGWVSARYTTEYGNCYAVAIETYAPPTTPPTTAPTLTPRPTSTTAPTVNPQTQRPDLTVSNIRFRTSQAALNDNAASTTVEFTVTVTNQGNTAATSFAVRGDVTAADDSAVTNTNGNSNSDDALTEFDFGVVGSLDAKQSIVLIGNIEFYALGEYRVTITADSDSQINETNESNNQSSTTIEIGRDS